MNRLYALETWNSLKGRIKLTSIDCTQLWVTEIESSEEKLEMVNEEKSPMFQLLSEFV